jgi:hypothetical protein
MAATEHLVDLSRAPDGAHLLLVSRTGNADAAARHTRLLWRAASSKTNATTQSTSLQELVVLPGEQSL